MALSRRITFRIPNEFAEKIELIASKSGLPFSEVLRRQIARSKPKFFGEETKKDRIKALRLMKKSSNNLDQIARHLNTLSLQGKLEYREFVHYLRILDTIEAQQHIILKVFDDN